MNTRKARLIPLVLFVGLLAGLPAISPAHAIADFTITASPSNLGNIRADLVNKVMITVTSTGGFAGTVTLSETDNGGVTASFNPTSVTVSSGGSGTSTLSISVACNAGPPPATIQGTSGSLSHTTTVGWGTVRC